MPVGAVLRGKKQQQKKTTKNKQTNKNIYWRKTGIPNTEYPDCCSISNSVVLITSLTAN